MTIGNKKQSMDESPVPKLSSNVALEVGEDGALHSGSGSQPLQGEGRVGCSVLRCLAGVEWLLFKYFFLVRLLFPVPLSLGSRFFLGIFPSSVPTGISELLGSPVFSLRI